MERELPAAFAETLAQSPSAMERFSAMSKAEQDAVLQNLSDVRSKAQMQALVASLAAPEQKTAADNQWTSTGIPPFSDNRERRDGPGGN